MRRKDQFIYGIVASAISVVLLLLATSDMQYGYYDFLRIFVTLAGLFTAYVGYVNKSYIVSILSLLVAMLFNPLIKITLEKDTWVSIDLITALYFLIVAIVFAYSFSSKRHDKE